MNVRLGWSGEIGGTWTKMDVEVDDSDLILHFTDEGCENPMSLKFSSVEKFKLMYSLAEIFVQLHKMARFPDYFNTERDREEISELIRVRDKLTREILTRNSNE